MSEEWHGRGARDSEKPIGWCVHNMQHAFTGQTTTLTLLTTKCDLKTLDKLTDYAL